MTDTRRPVTAQTDHTSADELLKAFAITKVKLVWRPWGSETRARRKV